MYKVAKICLDKELAEKAITAFEFAGHPLPKANVINRANHCLENKRFKDAVTLYEYAGMEKVKLRELLINKGDYYLISGDIHPAKECYLLANAKERVEFIEKNKLNLLEIKKDIEEFYKDL